MYYGRQSVHRPNYFTPNSQTNIHETLPPPTCKGVVHTLGNAKLEARTWLSRALSSYFSSMLARRAKRTRQPRSCYVTLSNIHQFKKKTFTGRLSNKLFLIVLLTTPPHLKYVATLPCNLSLIASFLTLMFHKVMWQHMQGVLRFFTTTLLQIY